MILSKKTLSTIALAGTILMTVGCSKDEDDVVTPTPTPTPSPTPSYTIPSTYAFVDAAGASNVSFSGQQQRLEMLSEMVTFMKTGNTPGTTVGQAFLKAMYANDMDIWTDAPGLGMTGSSKQLKSKTAGNDAGVQATFEGFMTSMDGISVASGLNATETYGTSGVWTNGVKSYLMDGNGYEYTQLIEKGLMCAVFMNQMTNNYLQSVSSDDNVTITTGKNYTAMQHHWDEAYGYFTSEVDYPTNGTNRFWGKYANGREAVLGSATKIAEAFRRGRAAIDNKDYTVRDAQITVIVDEMDKVCAGTAIHYLNGAKSNIASPTIKNHELSEARAFIDGLRYGQKSISGEGMSISEINTALGYIDDFANVTISDLNAAIDLIASKTGLTSVKATL